MAVTIDHVGVIKDKRTAEEAGDFEKLFQQNWRRVYEMLFQVLGDADEAEDLALETFWRLFHQPPIKVENLEGWLYRVALRLGYNALRAHRRRGYYEQEAGKLLLEKSNDDPARAAELAEECRRVRHVLGELKPKVAQLLILRHSGFSYQEIGAVLDIPKTSVGTLLVRAEKAFEKRYLQDGD